MNYNPSEEILEKYAKVLVNFALGSGKGIKKDESKYTWTLALYGTPSMAKEAGLSQQQYWQQIIKACYLDKADPIKEWKRISAEVERVAKKLTDLQIKELHVEGKDADLKITLGEKRKWRSEERRVGKE